MRHILLLLVYIAYFSVGYSQNTGNGSNANPMAQFHIKGNADTTQLLIDAASTQTISQPLIKLRNSIGIELLRIQTNDPSNLFIGRNAGFLNDSLTLNTFIGSNAGRYNTSGFQNTATGSLALYSNSIGNFNTATGTEALYSNTTGIANTAMGDKSLYSNSTGGYNTATGVASLKLNTTGNYNTANGSTALYQNTIGSYNTANGTGALSFNTTGNNNTANGYYALIVNTTGNYNTATGSESLVSNTTGSLNTATGHRALSSNTAGIANTAFGFAALYGNFDGVHNTAIGDYALANNNGNENTATGQRALYNIDYFATNENTANGAYALFNNRTGSYNTALGYNALYTLTSSNENTALGWKAGNSFNIGPANTIIGSNSDVAFTGSTTNSVSIGTAPFGFDGSNRVRTGQSTTVSIGGYANWTNISDGRVKKNTSVNVPGLSFINKLRPVTYNLDLDAADKLLQAPIYKEANGKIISLMEIEINNRHQKEQIVYSGFIAQEVEQAAKEVGYDFSAVHNPKNDGGLYGLSYEGFVVPLVKAVQELTTQNEKLAGQAAFRQQQIETLIKEIEARKSSNQALQKQINKLKQIIK